MKMMKTISKILSIAMLLGTSLQPSAYAQNLNKHIDNAENVALDYCISNEYILTGRITPPTVGGMPNVGPFAGNLTRLQLQKVDDKLNTVWAKTYAVGDEVATVQQGICQSLSNSFYVGDVKQTKDEGFIVCGEVRRDAETSGCGVLSNYDHLFMLKTDRDGNVQWFKRYDKYGMLNSVVETPDGDFIACGRLGGSGVSTGLIIYTDANGNLLWSKEALTPAYWDHDILSNGSEYYEVINFNGNFALVGIANYVGTVWAATNITVVDATGNMLQNSIIDNQIYGYVMSARAIADSHDGEVVITGMAGTPCNSGAQVFILKIEPYSMGVNFFRVYSYNNYGDASMGASIDVDGGERIFVTGVDWTNGGGAIYLETDYNGNLNRYTPFNATEATWGKGIVFNPAMGIPTFSGYYSPNMQSTFIIKNDQNYDCSPDVYMPDYTTPYEEYPSNDRDPGVRSIDDDAIAFDWDPKEGIACGKQKPGSTTSVANTSATALMLSPNPASEYLDVDMGNIPVAGSMLKVYDISGRVVTSRTLTSETRIRINTASLLPGMYTLNIVQQNGSVTRTNFIKD
jgi:hypothetical protein